MCPARWAIACERLFVVLAATNFEYRAGDGALFHRLGANALLGPCRAWSTVLLPHALCLSQLEVQPKGHERCEAQRGEA